VTRARSSPETSYVAEVLRLYTLLPDTPDRPRPHDRRLALALARQQVPLDQIRAAFILGTARRARSPRAPLPPIRSLHYFLPILEEVQQEPPDPSYLDLRERFCATSSSTDSEKRRQSAIFTE
jgi:hypothetical protein